MKKTLPISTHLAIGLLSLGLLVPLNNAYASSTVSEGTRPTCPSPIDIQAVNPYFGEAYSQKNGLYNTWTSSSRWYGNDHKTKWVLTIWNVPADSMGGAIEQSNHYLNREWQAPTAEKAADGDFSYVCTYHIEGTVTATATTDFE